MQPEVVFGCSSNSSQASPATRTIGNAPYHESRYWLCNLYGPVPPMILYSATAVQVVTLQATAANHEAAEQVCVIAHDQTARGEKRRSQDLLYTTVHTPSTHFLQQV